MSYCKPYPSPCEKCKRKMCAGKTCEDWKIRYLYRQKQINAFAKKCGLTVRKEGSTDNGN